jgi:beta-glucosidase
LSYAGFAWRLNSEHSMFTRNKPISRQWLSKFSWAVGVEDTFVPQFKPGQRALDEYELTGHYQQWRGDLDLAASLNVSQLRWGIPWFLVEPQPGVFDWRWTDEVLTYMVNQLHIEPIVDLVHYGTPIWLTGGFLDADFPQAMERLAGAFAERYKGLVQCYTPLNEPTVTADFCGRRGDWPPYATGDEGYAAVLVAIARAMQLSIKAIRAADREAVIFAVESTCRYLADDQGAHEAAELKFRHDMLPFDLVSGDVDESHPLYGWLLEHDVESETLAVLSAHGVRADVFGINFYPWAAHLLSSDDGEISSRGVHADGRMIADVIRKCSAHIDRPRHGKARRVRTPLYVTETSAAGYHRLHWMKETVDGVNLARAEGLRVIGYTWFPFISMIEWGYRNSTKPLSDHLLHLGLFELIEVNGQLKRVATSDVEAYRRAIRKGVVKLAPKAKS